jgi:hypothetical protein
MSSFFPLIEESAEIEIGYTKSPNEKSHNDNLADSKILPFVLESRPDSEEDL